MFQWDNELKDRAKAEKERLGASFGLEVDKVRNSNPVQNFPVAVQVVQ